MGAFEAVHIETLPAMIDVGLMVPSFSSSLTVESLKLHYHFSPLLHLYLWLILAGAFEAVHIESLPAVDAGLMVPSFSSSSHSWKLIVALSYFTFVAFGPLVDFSRCF